MARNPRRAWDGVGLWARVAAFVAGYVALIWVTYAMSGELGVIGVLWWPLDGLALGVLLRAPRSAWLPLLGTLAVTLFVLGLVGFPPPRRLPLATSLVFAAGDALGPFAGALVVRWLLSTPLSLQRVREVAALVAGVLATAVVQVPASVLGIFVWPEPRPPHDLAAIPLGQPLGALLVAAVVVTWPRRRRGARLRPERLLEAAACTLALAALATLVFYGTTSWLRTLAVGALTFPALGWVAVRFGSRGSAWALAGLTVAASLLAQQGIGPFGVVGEPGIRRAFSAQIYCGFVALGTLFLAALIADQRRVHRWQELNVRAEAALSRRAPLDERLERVAALVASGLASRCTIRLDGAVATSGLPRTDGAPDGSWQLPIPLAHGEGRLELEPSQDLGTICRAGRAGARVLAEHLAAAAAEDDLRRALSGREAELRHAMAILDALLASAPIGIAVHDLELNLVRGNPALATIVGVPLEQLPGRTVAELLPDVHPFVVDRMREAIAGGQAVVAEVAIRSGRTGEVRHCLCTWFPIAPPGGAVAGLSWIAFDVTERAQARRAAEAALAEAREAIRIRDQFLTAASHELKTPLTPLAARLALLRRGLADGTREAALADKSLATLRRLQRLAADLVDTSALRARGTTLEREPVPLRRVVEAAAEPWRGYSDRHHVELVLPEEELRVTGDARRLERVVDALLSNALKFSPRGGTIRVSLRAEGGEARLDVADEGIGIPPEDGPRLFERFYRASNVSPRSYGGLGLGLPLARLVVEGHGGRVWVESALGRGTTVHVALPLLRPSDEHRGAPADGATSAQAPVELARQEADDGA